MTEPILQCRAVTKSYKAKNVLRGLDMDVPAGSVVGLLGKNGSGKTTLIKCALGLLRPDSGDITIFGEPAWDLSAKAKARIGYVPQAISLFTWMKVSHIIDYTASFYPQWNQTLIDDLVSRFELDRSAMIGALSGGQLQKLAILLSLGHEPDLLILDEPAAALDPIVRREFLAALLAVAAETRRTVLFSTHITSDIERIADRVVILKAGQVHYSGALDSLKDKVKRLHISASRPLPREISIPGALRQEIDGNTARVTIADATAELVARVESEYGAQVRIEDLNLDDIFLEVHHDA